MLVITGAGETTFCAGWDLQDAADLDELGDYDAFRVILLQLPRRVRLHAQGRHLQAGDRRRQRLRVRRRAGDGAARRHPDRRRERRVRRARAALEHRRRRRDDRPAAARRRLRQGDGADHHRPADRRPRGERIGLVNEVVPRGQALERAQELAHEIAALPQGAIRSDKESVMRGVGRTLEERLQDRGRARRSRCSCAATRTRIGAAAFKAGNLSPEWPHHGL